MDSFEVLNIKKRADTKIKFCHYLLTLVSFQICGICSFTVYVFYKRNHFQTLLEGFKIMASKGYYQYIHNNIHNISDSVISLSLTFYSFY